LLLHFAVIVNPGTDYYDYDLTIKFSTHEIVATIDELQDSEQMDLTLTGELADGTKIEGKDFGATLKKGKK